MPLVLLTLFGRRRPKVGEQFIQRRDPQNADPQKNREADRNRGSLERRNTRVTLGTIIRGGLASYSPQTYKQTP